MNDLKSITVHQLAELVEKEAAVDIIDVRTSKEFHAVHASTAINIPLNSLNPDSVMKSRNNDKPVYLICQGGNRSNQAYQKFIKAGFQSVVNVEGGTNAWDQAGLAVIRGDSTITSLQRQVLIIAGLMILIGSLVVFFNNYIF